MQIQLICVGQKMPDWVTQGYQDYAKRLPASCSLQLVEIPLLKRGKNADIARFQREEGEKTLQAIAPQAHVVALDERGQAWNTLQLSEQLAQWMQTARTVALLVGSPEGLAPACLERAQQRWSLSALTLPHPLVRIVVAEQIYRAWSVLQNHPYHRA
ncbi:rRNA large subunit m3Psi methyltransferase RlmH [Beggiatoa alba B18LD]|uniref:Ribosomal RNA large subunit methyltransferase H n=1 Tax=Beggiatoa alba B18LD TaxID=395493 RepID=I3CCC4_9GAMM|nr:23S rRNA (pseudouridine(1915)-N(3))-methyltransferase RlmH [Beggiatoa alba]EIJ41267.1 rRNA large subunit m3Psi methyltransferase RlmH [Beggiatoa alba B18LD]